MIFERKVFFSNFEQFTRDDEKTRKTRKPLKKSSTEKKLETMYLKNDVLVLTDNFITCKDTCKSP